jgi:hypothetical protein
LTEYLWGDKSFDTWLADQEFIFAKTYADTAPHEYIKRDDYDGEQLSVFCDFIRHIRATGYEDNFYSTTYTYLDLDGYKYWTMGNPIEKTRIINREPLDGY